MIRLYQNLLARRPGLAIALPKPEALKAAKRRSRKLTVQDVDGELAALARGEVRPLANDRGAPAGDARSSSRPTGVRLYNHLRYWAAFVLVGDTD